MNLCFLVKLSVYLLLRLANVPEVSDPLDGTVVLSVGGVELKPGPHARRKLSCSTKSKSRNFCFEEEEDQ